MLALGILLGNGMRGTAIFRDHTSLEAEVSETGRGHQISSLGRARSFFPASPASAAELTTLLPPGLRAVAPGRDVGPCQAQRCGAPQSSPAGEKSSLPFWVCRRNPSAGVQFESGARSPGDGSGVMGRGAILLVRPRRLRAHKGAPTPETRKRARTHKQMPDRRVHKPPLPQWALARTMHQG